MADVLLAGDPEELLAGIEGVLSRHGEQFDRVDMEITDPMFIDSLGEHECGVVISRFHDGDLASIKAMQIIRSKRQCLRFIFVTAKELASPILTLMFNEGAYGLLQEPFTEEAATQIVKQAVKRSRWDLDEIARSSELNRVNKNLKDRMERQEILLTRQGDIIDRLERLIFFLLHERSFKPNKVRIMFVSDSAYQREIIEGTFARLGFFVTGLESAELALQSIPNFKPDIVVSDLELPGMSGVEFAKEVKGKKGNNEIYFVILTANEDKMDYILSPETKVDDCVIKPGDTEKYHGMVAKVALGILSL